MVSPLGANAPKDWPPPPVHSMVNVSSGRVFPWMRVISEPKIVPIARLVLETSSLIVDFLPFSSARAEFCEQRLFVQRFAEAGSPNSSAFSQWVGPE